MEVSLQKSKAGAAHKIISAFVAISFLFTIVIPPGGASAQVLQGILNLPAPGMMVNPTAAFTPLHIKGLTLHPENPLKFDFIIDTGNSGIEGEALKEETRKLVKYFLAALTIPEDELWVNLSPYEKDKIIADSLSQTDMGRDMLSQDYLLKQLSASMLYPEDELGKKFWDRVYKKAYEQYGTTQIPLNTFNKIWIIPDSAVVFEKGLSTFVVKSTMKVMLEEDFVALKENAGSTRFGTDQLKKDDVDLISGVTSEIVREILIPEIEKEVNEGATFANLRQIFNSMILAAWYKKNLRNTLLGQVYVDQNKTAGIDLADKQVKEKIYSQYLEALKKGVYNYIREDYDIATDETIPRKYFSGGVEAKFIARVRTIKDFNKLEDDERGALEEVGTTYNSHVELTEARSSGQAVWENQDNSTDLLVAAGFDESVKWITQRKITYEDVVQGREIAKPVIEALVFLEELSAQGFSSAENLKDYLYALLKGEMPEHLGSAPQLNVFDIPDRAAVEAIMKAKIPGGHASDRGVHLFTQDAKTLLHELLAFAGFRHSQSVAFEIAIEKWLQEKPKQPVNIAAILTQEQLITKYRARLAKDGESKNWDQSFEETFRSTDADLGKDFSKRTLRPTDLLTRMKDSAVNIRDVAMFEKRKERKRQKEEEGGKRTDEEEEIRKRADEEEIRKRADEEEEMSKRLDEENDKWARAHYAIPLGLGLLGAMAERADAVEPEAVSQLTGALESAGRELTVHAGMVTDMPLLANIKELAAENPWAVITAVVVALGITGYQLLKKDDSGKSRLVRFYENLQMQLVRRRLARQASSYSLAEVNAEPGLRAIDPTADSSALKAAEARADVIVGGVFVQDTAPTLMDDKTLGEASRQNPKVIVDVAIDQGSVERGGNIAPAFPTHARNKFTHAHPAQIDKHGNLRLSIPNMPAAFGEVASPFLSEATQPIAMALVSNKSTKDILSWRPEIRGGVITTDGRVTNEKVARVHGYGFDGEATDAELGKVLRPSAAGRVVGVLAEIKPGERRIAKVIEDIREMVSKAEREGGAQKVLIQRGAGEKSGIYDAQFEVLVGEFRNRVEIVDSAQEVWERADIIIKVKEPLAAEFQYFREGLIIYAYFHADGPDTKDLVQQLVDKKVTALAYEKVEVDGDTPLLKPMSRVAGWISGLWGALYARAGINYAQDVDPKTGIIKEERVQEINRQFAVLYNYIQEHFQELRSGTFRFPEHVLKRAGLPNAGAQNAVFLGGGDVGREAAYMSLLLGVKGVTVSDPALASLKPALGNADEWNKIYVALERLARDLSSRMGLRGEAREEWTPEKLLKYYFDNLGFLRRGITDQITLGVNEILEYGKRLQGWLEAPPASQKTGIDPLNKAQLGFVFLKVVEEALLKEKGGFSIKAKVEPLKYFNNPKLLETEGVLQKLLGEDTYEVKVLVGAEDFPENPEIRAGWDNHYAVFEVRDKKTNYTGYISMHDLVKISSHDKRVDGKFMWIGGLRKMHYADDVKKGELLALADALRLSAAMTRKNSMVIPIGGGKTAVHVHDFDPGNENEEYIAAHQEARDAISISLMHVYDTINKALGGNGGFVAEDQNMTVRDMEVMYNAIPDNPWVLPNSDPANNEHPSPYTALGVIKGLERAVPFVPGWENDTEKPLDGKHVALQAIGNIGKENIRILLQKGAKVVAADVKENAYKDFVKEDLIREAIKDKRLFIFKEEGKDIYNPFVKYGKELAEMGITPDGHAIDIFSPNGPPLLINDETIKLLKDAGVKMVGGSTNNPLASDEMARTLFDQDILYLVDWVINSAGVQAVAGTHYFIDGIHERKASMETITDNTADTVRRVLEEWHVEGRIRSVLKVAEEMSEKNIAKMTHAPRPGSSTTPGGIDFNPALLNMQIKRDPNGVPLPLLQQPILDINIDGFIPVILDMTPIMSIPVFLGVAEPQRDDNQLTHNELSPFDHKLALK